MYLIKDKKRAYNLFYKAKKKERFKKLPSVSYRMEGEEDNIQKKILGKAVNTPHPRSFYGLGNMRKKSKGVWKLTIQERKSLLKRRFLLKMNDFDY